MPQKRKKCHKKSHRNETNNTQNQNQNQSQTQGQNKSQNENQNQSQTQDQNNWYMNLNRHDKIELQLLELGIAATYVDIFSTLLGLLAAKRSEQLIYQRAMARTSDNTNNNANNNGNPNTSTNTNANQNTNTNGNQNTNNTNGNTNTNQNQQQETEHPTPGELATFASCLGVFTIVIYTRISLIRYEQVQELIQEGNTKYTLEPNIKVTTGFMFSVLGSLLRTMGAIQRINEEGQIVFVF